MSAMEGLAPGRGITSPGSYCLASGTSAPTNGRAPAFIQDYWIGV